MVRGVYQALSGEKSFGATSSRWHRTLPSGLHDDSSVERPKKKIEKPLINSVVFVKTNERALNELYSIQGIHGVLKYLGRPAVVQAHEIMNLRILLQEVHVEDIEQVDIQAGDLVEVIRGPFKGMQACAIQMQNSMRLIIEIKNMGVGFSVNVPKTYVKRL